MVKIQKKSKEEPPNDESVYSLLDEMKKLKVTPGKSGFKKSRKSGINVSSSTGRVKMDISNTGIKKKNVRQQQRLQKHRLQKITRHTEKTLASLFSDKLGVGTKKKRKKRRSKRKKKKRRKRRSKTKRN